MSDTLTLLIYFTPMALIFWAYLRRQRQHHAISLATKREAQEAGLTEPASLHPEIDPTICVGCAACVTICPVDVFDYVDEQPVDTRDDACVYCELCVDVCPVEAMSMVSANDPARPRRRLARVEAAEDEVIGQPESPHAGLGQRRQLLADRQKLVLQLARFVLRIGKGEEPERHRQR